MDKKNLLVCADFVAHTGFSRVTHSILDKFSDYFNIVVLGVNYRGDYTPFQSKYRIYNPTAYNGDVYGFNRLNDVIAKENIDIVFIINDSWIVTDYVTVIREKHKELPIVAYVPVDAEGLNPKYVKGFEELATVITYTNYAKEELIKAGVTNSISVIPHGVDTNIFYPEKNARSILKIPEELFIVNVTERNSLRKRIDLSFQAFSEFAKDKPNVRLYYHGALEDVGYNILHLAKFFGVTNKLILSSSVITPSVGVTLDKLRLLYNMSNVGLSTAMGEGWGLPTMERMACNVPMIVPNNAAYSEWCKDSAYLVSCESAEGYTNYFAHPNSLTTMGKCVDMASTVNALNTLYYDAELLNSISNAGYARVNEERFKWSNIASEFEYILKECVK